jgi:hypothetical protein
LAPLPRRENPLMNKHGSRARSATRARTPNDPLIDPAPRWAHPAFRVGAMTVWLVWAVLMALAFVHGGIALSIIAMAFWFVAGGTLVLSNDLALRRHRRRANVSTIAPQRSVGEAYLISLWRDWRARRSAQE